MAAHSNRLPGRTLAFVVLAGVLSVPVAAQETPPVEASEPAAPAEAAPPPPPKPIPVSDIASSAEAATGALREIRSQLDPLPDVTTIEQNLSFVVETVDELERQTEARDLNAMTPDFLEDLRRQWSRQQSALQKSQDVLTARAERLGEWKDELSTMRDVWTLTKSAAAEQQDLPETVMTRVDSVLAEIEDVEAQLNERRSAVLTLQGKNSQELSGVGAEIAAVDAAFQESRTRLFSKQGVPIWKSFSEEGEKEPLATQFKSVWQKNVSDLAEFGVDYRIPIRFHLAIFIALALSTAVLRRRIDWKDDADVDLRAAAHVLSRPFSSALLIALLLTPWVYPDAPRVVSRIALTLAMIPVLRLLPALVSPKMRIPLYVLAGMYLFGRFGELAIHQPGLRRFLALLFDGGSFVLAAWFVRPNGLATRIRPTAWWKAALFLARIGVGLLGIALITNILGLINLSDLLAIGTLLSVFFGVVMLTGSLALCGLVTALLRTDTARRSGAIREHGDTVKRRAVKLIHLAALAMWLWGALSVFGLWDPVIDGLTAALTREWTIGTFSLSLGDVLAFVVVVFVAVKISQLIRFVLDQDVMPRLDLPRGVPSTISMLVNYAILAVGFLIAISAAGFELDRLTLLIGALGVGIGFGLQNLVNNFVSGLILIFERPIKIGDTVDVGTLRGEVRRIGIRSSTVRTFEGAEVIVPNGNLISNEVINWTLTDRTRRIEVKVGVKYGTDPQTVLDLLLKTAGEHEDVVEDPKPRALFQEFGDSSLNFSLRFWTRKFDDWLRIQSDVTVAVNNALNAAGIEIPFPQRDLHVRSVDPGTGLGKGERAAEPASPARSGSKGEGAL